MPNYRVKGYLCKTNIPSNTAFRGFGAPQGMFVMETAISDVALKLNIPREKVWYFSGIETFSVYKRAYSRRVGSSLILPRGEELIKRIDPNAGEALRRGV